MAITSAIVLFAVIWFLVMFITLPIRLRTQGDGAAHSPNQTKREKEKRRERETGGFLEEDRDSGAAG